MKLVLASASPRRKDLLEGMGLAFEVFVSEAPEDFPEGTPAISVPEILAIRKAEAVQMLKPDCLILAADTVVEADGVILNKPANSEEALLMLERLSGKVHHVHTGYCLLSPGGMISGTDSTAVQFAALHAAEKHHYINSGKPFDKAGAYGIQEWIGLIGVERIEGSYFTVMGLPTHKIWESLKQIGFPGLI
jgi:septum formation protein